MNCQGVIREISNYIDGDLDAAAKIELEQHLELCEDCLLVVNQTKLTIEVFCDEEAVELPTDVKSRLHEALRRKIGESKS